MFSLRLNDICSKLALIFFSRKEEIVWSIICSIWNETIKSFRSNTTLGDLNSKDQQCSLRELFNPIEQLQSCLFLHFHFATSIQSSSPNSQNTISPLFIYQDFRKDFCLQVKRQIYGWHDCNWERQLPFIVVNLLSVFHKIIFHNNQTDRELETVSSDAYICSVMHMLTYYCTVSL